MKRDLALISIPLLFFRFTKVRKDLLTWMGKGSGLKKQGQEI